MAPAVLSLGHGTLYDRGEENQGLSWTSLGAIRFAPFIISESLTGRWRQEQERKRGKKFMASGGGGGEPFQFAPVPCGVLIVP